MKLAATSFVTRNRWLCFATTLLASATALAQYPTGKPVTQQSNNPRAVAVLEWTGQPGKPNASRLIPITIYINGQFQDGGLYQARPEPMTLDNGTEYELQLAGQPKGFFDVETAGHVPDTQFDNIWYGYGSWKALPKSKPPSALLLARKPDAYVVGGENSSEPHFAHRPGKADSATTSSAAKKSSDAPVLVNRSGDAQEQPSSDSKKNTAANNAPLGADDPDRPTLRHRKEAPQQPTYNASSAAVTAVGSYADANDPDRPRLQYGKPASTNADQDLSKLTGNPPHLEQMVAVSDATDRDPHLFTFTWANMQQEQDAQNKLKALAQQAIAATLQPTRPAASSAQKKIHTRKAVRHSKPTPPALQQLQNVRFHTYSLSYAGDATMVLSAHTDGTGAHLKYVTLIATNDIYGDPQVLFTNVTDAAHLDQTPRMKLVDAVDADADGRAELLFELDGMNARQFALYSVAAGRASQIFATSPLP